MPRFPERIWRSVFYLLTVVFLGLLIRQILQGTEGQWMALLAAVVSLIASRADDIVKLKLSKEGLEAEMREVLEDARATVTQLHLLAGELSKIILQAIQAEGRFGGGTTTRDKEKMRTNVLSTLDQLGLSKEAIKEIMKAEQRYVLFDLAGYVVEDIRREIARKYPDKGEEFYSSSKRKGIGYEPSPDELEAFLRSLDALTPEVTERLADYRHYAKTGEHRRPQEWLGRHD